MSVYQGLFIRHALETGKSTRPRRNALTLEPVPQLILSLEVKTSGSVAYLRSGELARLTAVSTDTLRHYERVGVLAPPARTRAGYRTYPPEAVERVKLVRRAVAMGFSLAELARILQVKDRGGAPCRQVHALAVEKLALLSRRIAELSELRRELRATVKQWDLQLTRTPDGQRAGLLEMLVHTPSEGAHENEIANGIDFRRSLRRGARIAPRRG
ncbi:MAG TPA: heavy metal-responsive transcriptional regulator [Bryobacteraceae bacterium]|nr:heavy metal-responsive transcriptional regulator [Bryobacteraceae bacterium]